MKYKKVLCWKVRIFGHKEIQHFMYSSFHFLVEFISHSQKVEITISNFVQEKT